MNERQCYRIVDARAGLGDPDWRRCERCGSTDCLTHHHRIKRSHGVRHDPANVVVLCLTCHPWVEQHFTDANVQGWALRASEDPLVVPIFHHPSQARVRLDNDGMITHTD